MVITLTLSEALKNLQLPHFGENLFSSAEWLSVSEKTYKLKFFVKYLIRHNTISSYIIYSVVNNFLERKICISSYCDYFDCYIENKEDWDLFFESLRKDYPDYRIAIRNLRDQTVRESPHFEKLSTERYHILDVRDPIDIIWKRSHDSFRSAVKQAEKLGVTVKQGDKATFNKFYEFHVRLRKSKYRLFAQPYRFFENIWDAYVQQNKGFILGAYDLNGSFVSGTVYLICGNTLYYKFNTSDLKALKFRPNNLVFWEGIKIAKERNLEFIDLGSSGNDQKGLIMFKEHAGAKSQEITHLGFTPPNYKFSHKIILKTFTSFCTAPWVPDSITKMGSTIIYPYLA